LQPVTQAGWSARDKQLMSNLPYAQATIPERKYRRHIVQYARQEAPGTIVVDSGSKFLYYVLPKGQAIRYGVTVGEDAQAWSGIVTVGPQGRMAVVDTDRRRTRAAWAYPGLCDRRTAKSNGCARAIFVLWWQGHTVPGSTAPTSLNISAEPSPRLHSHDQRGCGRPLQSRQSGHNCRGPRAVVHSTHSGSSQRLNDNSIGAPSFAAAFRG